MRNEKDCGCGAGDYEDDEDDRRTFDTDYDDHDRPAKTPEAWPTVIEIPTTTKVPEKVPAGV